MSIYTLPDDVVRDVGELLDGRSLAQYGAVSRRMHHVVTGAHSSRAKYIVELERLGMVDGGSSERAAELLRKLTQYTQAWSTLQWSLSTTLPLPGSHHHTLFLGDGVNRVDTSFAGVSGGCIYLVYCASPPDAPLEWLVKILSLPSARTGHTFATRTFSYPVPIKAIAIDPTQNLLVLLDATESQDSSTCLWFMDLTTSAQHPKAHTVSMKGFPRKGRNLTVSQFEIHGPMLGLLFRASGTPSFGGPSHHHLQFINWKTGDRLFPAGDRVPAPFIWSFHFLNERQALIGESSSRSRQMQMTPRLRLCSLTTTNRKRDTDYDLPWWGPIYADKLPKSITFVRNVSPAAHTKPAFRPDPALRLLGIKLEFGDHVSERPLDTPQHALCIIDEAFFTSGQSPPGWFDRLRYTAPVLGYDLAFIGTKLLSSVCDESGAWSIFLRDFGAHASRVQAAGGWTPHPSDPSWQTAGFVPPCKPGALPFTDPPVPTTVTNPQYHVNKVIATEDNIVLFLSTPHGGEAQVRVLNF